jgi:hypothetical protein
MTSDLRSMRRSFLKIFAFALGGLEAVQAGRAMYAIAWGTGKWLGEFSLKWAILFAGFLLLSAFLLIFFALWLWRPERFLGGNAWLFRVRRSLGGFRWVFGALLLTFPVFVLQYTFWGLVFHSPYLRLWFWILNLLLLGMLFSEGEALISKDAFLLALLASSTVFALAAAFSNVKRYPFNLFWSDGNRLWDYSVLFGRRLYDYPPNKPIPAYISLGRQALWGLPFLLPHPTIFLVRLWSAFVLTFPYAFLGWVLFGKRERGILQFLAGMWVFLFLDQGPIYTPLILAAILVAYAWRQSLWLAFPFVAIAGYYAQSSRVTWLVAPAMWIGMLEVADIRAWTSFFLPLRKWTRAVLLVFGGVLGGVLLPLLQQYTAHVGAENAVAGISYSLHQPLLWYRLLPSDTYPLGVLLGLLLAVAPLGALLVYWKIRGFWRPFPAQRVVYTFALLAFLAVGLTASAKIGGGSNLHNLDMFLVGCVFLAAIVWDEDAGARFRSWRDLSAPLTFLLAALFFIPGVQPLFSLSPRLHLSEQEIRRVETLTDYVPYVSPPIPSLPSSERVEEILQILTTRIQQASEKGEVLFIDQRQLLTFGYVPRIPLVPEYEKKWMMDEALSGDAAYFQPYYEDLANHRFQLIVTETLKIHYVETEEGVFPEENDAWTKWVAEPTLCFYEPIETFRDIQLQLLVPREDISACERYLNGER